METKSNSAQKVSNGVLPHYILLEKAMREIRVSQCGGGAWESNPPSPTPGEPQLDLKTENQ